MDLLREHGLQLAFLPSLRVIARYIGIDWRSPLVYPPLPLSENLKEAAHPPQMLKLSLFDETLPPTAAPKMDADDRKRTPATEYLRLNDGIFSPDRDLSNRR